MAVGHRYMTSTMSPVGGAINWPDIFEERDDVEPEILRQLWLSHQHEAPQIVTVDLQKLVDGVLTEGVSVADVHSLQAA